MGQTRNLLYAYAYRGFNSHPLRQFIHATIGGMDKLVEDDLDENPCSQNRLERF